RSKGRWDRQDRTSMREKTLRRRGLRRKGTRWDGRSRRRKLRAANGCAATGLCRGSSLAWRITKLPVVVRSSLLLAENYAAHQLYWTSLVLVKEVLRSAPCKRCRSEERRVGKEGRYGGKAEQ